MSNHQHCETCKTSAREVIKDNLIGDLADELGIDYDVAARRVTEADVDQAVTAYLDRIVGNQSQTLTTNPNSTCSAVHADWY